MAKDEKDNKKMGYDEAGPRKDRKTEKKYDPHRLSDIADENEEDPVIHKYKQDNYKDVRRNDDPSNT